MLVGHPLLAPDDTDNTGTYASARSSSVAAEEPGSPFGEPAAPSTGGALAKRSMSAGVADWGVLPAAAAMPVLVRITPLGSRVDTWLSKRRPISEGFWEDGTGFWEDGT